MPWKFNPFTATLDWYETGSDETDPVFSAWDKDYGDLINTPSIPTTCDDLTDGTTYKRFSSTEQSKLSGIETNADVTDATNVAAAGAVMESDTSIASMSFVIDEDDMTSNSNTKIPTQQSVKAYVDANSGIDNISRDNDIILAWKLAIHAGLTIFNLEDGVVDEFEDETGIDTVNSVDESYNSTDDYYSPASGTTVDLMEYATDALAQAAYVTNATAEANVASLLNFNGASIIDEVGKTWSIAGDAVLSSTTPKFGAGCLNFPGTNGKLSTSDANIRFDQSFTLEMWFRMTDKTKNMCLFNHASYTYASFDLYFIGQRLTTYISSNGSSWNISSGTTGAKSSWSDNTWYKVILQFNGSAYKVYVGEAGSSMSEDISITTSSAPYYHSSIAGLCVGIRGYDNAYDFAGDIDGLRVSLGAAKYSSAPTPETEEFHLYSLQSYSESTIKEQGSYSLKGVGTITGSLNKTLTRTVSSPIDLSGINILYFKIRSSRTGSNIKIGIHDTGGTTTEITPNITSADTWQTVTWNISAVADANKDAIDSIIITLVNADASNTFYIDAFSGPLSNMTLISNSKEAEAEPTTVRLLALVEPVDSITVNTDIKGYVSLDDGSNYEQVTLTDEGYFDAAKKVLAGNETMTDRSDKTMRLKITTHNNKNLKVHAWALYWRS